MKIEEAIRKGFKKFPDGTWKMKKTENHILKSGKKTSYSYWQTVFERECYECGRSFISHNKIRKLRCSRECIPDVVSRYKHPSGYIYIHFPKSRWKAEHRLVMENHLGRPLDRSEYIHHINHNRSDNRLENLQIVSLSEHNKIHKPEEVKNWKRDRRGRFH